jgi:hypothetical protein
MVEAFDDEVLGGQNWRWGAETFEGNPRERLEQNRGGECD